MKTSSEHSGGLFSIALCFAVMVSTGNNNDIIGKDFVNQTVFMGDTAGQTVSKLFYNNR